MRSVVRGLVVALTLASVSWLPAPHAFAADVLPVGGLVQVLPVGGVIGDGATSATLHVLALQADGSPMLGLKLKAEAAGAEVGEIIELGKGLYKVQITPGAVLATRTVKVTVRGKATDKSSIEVSRDLVVQPAPAGRVSITANPAAVVLGVDTSVTLSFQIPDTGAGLPAAEDLIVRTSAGEVSSIVSLGGGRYSGRFTPPKVNYPHLALVTVADRRKPEVVRGSVVVPLQGRVDYPVQSKPGSTVILRLAGREFGPVPTAGDGRALVPIVVPPGLAKATLVTITGGVAAETELDLGIPDARRLIVFPVSSGFPADSGLTIPIRFLVTKGDGTPDPEAAIDVTATAGRIGRPTHLGEGIYEAPYTPPDGRVQMAATIQATLPGGTVQTDAIELSLLPAIAAKLELSTDPVSLAPEGTGLKVFARLLAPDGTGLGDRALRMEAAGATIKGNVTDLSGGDYRADFTAGGKSDVVVEVTAPPAASKNSVAHIVVLPSAEHIAPDGVTSSPVTIATTDAWGYPVPGVEVSLSVKSGGGSLPSSVTTDAFGLARVFYTAGGTPGFVTIEASGAGQVGAAGVVLTTATVPDLPSSGGASDVRVHDAWEKLRGVIVVPREGSIGAPVASTADVAAVGTLAALSVTTEPASVAPGGTVTVKIRALDATGRGVPGAKLDLLATNGSRFGAVTDLGGGDYQTTLTAAPDAAERVRISVLDPAGATSAILEVPVALTTTAAGTPWEAQPKWGETTGAAEPVAGTAVADTTTPTEPAKPAKEPKEPKTHTSSSIERPLFRGRVSALISSYGYTQEPTADAGGLLNSVLSWGGESGGAALPVGLEVNARGYIPQFKYIGFLGSFRFSRYKVESAAFSEPARDNLLATHVDALIRAPIQIGESELSIGGRVGFRWDDFVTFRGCTEVGCTVEYKPLGVPALGAGLELSAEFWKMYAILSGHAGFAYGSQPYASNVDLNVGWNITKNVFIDAGFGYQARKAQLEGADSGLVRGTVSDNQLLGTLGVGASF